MTARLEPNSDDMAQFNNYASLEQQAFFLISLLVSRENAYNTANPSSLSNRATIAVNFDQRNITGQLTASLNDNAIEGKLVDSIVPFLP